MALPLPQWDREIFHEEMRHFRALRGESEEKIEVIFSPRNKDYGKQEESRET